MGRAPDFEKAGPEPDAPASAVVSRSSVAEFVFIRLFSLLLLLAMSLPAWGADEKKEKKEEKKPEPPRVLVAMPLAVTPGSTIKGRVRGNNLENATELRFTNASLNASVVIQTKAKVEVPKDADAKKVGDSQMEVEWKFPAGTKPGTNWFTVTSTNGVSEPHPLVLLLADELIEEKEPNGGFKQAQAVTPGKILMGVVKEAADVDVFQFEGKAGQRVRVEVTAAGLGSALDSIVTLYDSGGHVLAANDDVQGRADSVLSVKLRADGVCFVSLIDAQDRGGATSVYLLKITVEE